jgi:ElaB/YqjD/DUF883 family membrane-anchored ribosome-binding protein
MNRQTTETVTTSRLAATFRQMLDGADQLLRDATRNGSDQFTAARERFASQVSSARRELEQIQDTALYRARRAVRTADRTVRDHPYATLGAVAGVALLVGWLLSRRD